MRWLDGITNNEHEFDQTPGNSQRQESLVCCSGVIWGRKELDTTEQLNWIELAPVIQQLQLQVIIQDKWKYLFTKELV